MMWETFVTIYLTLEAWIFFSRYASPGQSLAKWWRKLKQQISEVNDENGSDGSAGNIELAEINSIWWPFYILKSNLSLIPGTAMIPIAPVALYQVLAARRILPTFNSLWALWSQKHSKALQFIPHLFALICARVKAEPTDVSDISCSRSRVLRTRWCVSKSLRDTLGFFAFHFPSICILLHVMQHGHHETRIHLKFEVLGQWISYSWKELGCDVEQQLRCYDITKCSPIAVSVMWKKSLLSIPSLETSNGRDAVSSYLCHLASISRDKRLWRCICRSCYIGTLRGQVSASPASLSMGRW